MARKPSSPLVASVDATTAAPGSRHELASVLNPSDASSAAAAPPAKRARTLTPVVTLLSSPIVVEPMTQRAFCSWEEADAYLSAYAARTFQVLSAKTTTAVSTRNSVVRERLNTMTPAQQAGLLAQDKLIPEHFGCYSKSIICTHGRKTRPQGKGERVNQQLRALGCPAKLNLCVSKSVGGWRVRVTDQVSIHNHALSAELFATYPINRRVTDPRVLEIVREMRRYGTPRKGIFEFITKKTGKNVSMKDVHNLLAKMKKDDDEAAQAEASEGRDTEAEAIREEGEDRGEDEVE